MLFVIQFSWFNLSIFNAFFCVKMLQETHYTLKDMHNLCTLNVYKKTFKERVSHFNCITKWLFSSGFGYDFKIRKTVVRIHGWLGMDQDFTIDFLF